jgi:polyisoprenoid-binding protein YceI
MSLTEQSTHLEALRRDGRAHGRWILDPSVSTADFHVKHFWGALTVHGWFERLQGEANITPDGRIAGRLTISATSLQTKNAQRDRHLRSSDFFDVDRHPEVQLDITDVHLATDGELTAKGTLAVAGHRQTVEFPILVEDVTADDATLRAELTVDRTQFGMTWSPLGMASPQARLTASLRFRRHTGD